MLNDPNLRFADEPTANLDAESSRHVMTLLNAIREKGTAIVLSTHNDALPIAFTGRIFHIKEGKLTPETSNETNNEITDPA